MIWKNKIKNFFFFLFIIEANANILIKNSVLIYIYIYIFFEWNIKKIKVYTLKFLILLDVVSLDAQWIRLL